MAELVAKIAARKPDEAALIDERGVTTWAELDGRVNRLVHALRAAGLGDGDTVAVMVGNRRELFEILVACTHASWVYVPVNWHWVADELAYVLADAGAKALLVEDAYLDTAVTACAQASDCSVRVVVGAGSAEGFVGYEDLLAGASDAEPDGQATGGPMFYTSGTTGFPKGVRSSLSRTGAELGLIELITAGFSGMLGLPADGVTLLEGPAYHSAQWVFSLFPLLGIGSTLVMRHRFDPAETLELIDAHGVTNVHLVPTQFTRLLRLPEEVKAGFDGSSLQVVMHGAAPCPPEVKRAMLEWWGPVVSEYYGGTELGFVTTISGAEWLERPGSLGRPVATAEVMIVREDGTPADPGEAGQIYVRNLTGGDFEYHNAPEKTAAAHLEPGVATLGDIGYVDEDGYLFMSDRKIDMIISGGVNIYPAEIEGVLCAHPSVADAAVFGIPDDEFGERVMAVVELVDGSGGDDALAEVLVAHCRDHLAGYKAPRQLEFTDALPRTPTGKLQKRLLRDPYWEGTGRTI